MTINELYLNVKNGSLADCIQQTQIRSQKYKQRCKEKGYDVRFTVSEFRKMFPGIDPANISYSTSIGFTSFYFNRETLAVCPFHVDFLLLEKAKPSSSFSGIEMTLKAIQSCEEAAAKGDYSPAIINLPDRMRLEFFDLLVKKHGSQVPGLYKMFFDAYQRSDYGFKALDKDTLKVILESKTEEDRKRTQEVIKDLPEIITVYRGGNTESTAFKEAYSWTMDINIANFFAARRGYGPGYIAKAKICRDEIIEAFLDAERSNGEKEIIIAPEKVYCIENISLPGTELLEDVLPNVAPCYHVYRDKLANLQFTQETADHDKLHAARVLLITQILAEYAGLSSIDRELLAMASIYHDTRRTHDGDDTVHGEAAARYYHENEMVHHPIVEFLCKYHCLPDEEGYACIEANEDLCNHGTERVRQLYQIFKDADALDRVRFDIRALDLDQLRIPVSKVMTLVARINFEQVKLPI